MPPVFSINATVQKRITSTSSGADTIPAQKTYQTFVSAELGDTLLQRKIDGGDNVVIDFASALTTLKGVCIAITNAADLTTPAFDVYLDPAGTKIPCRDFFLMTFHENPAELRIENPAAPGVLIKLEIWALGE